MKTMNSISKIIISTVTGLMTAAAIATTAGAAEYYSNNGSYWFDGVYDGKVYVEGSDGYYRDLDEYSAYSSYRDCGRNTLYSENYIDYDEYYGNVYYRADCGYYTSNGSGTKYLGRDFVFTRYIGKDRYNRNIYYRKELGYIYIDGNTWYTLGYNIENISVR